ncbi:MAG: riboflavin kinase [Bacteroidales bacterium]|nr:riboflavin kinase [Bacteroidales bacterium]
MRVHYGLESLNQIRNAVVTTGLFDGVHIGHKTIINKINQIAQSINGQSVLITFYPHPRKVLYPETEGKDLMFISSQTEKIELLRKAGLDHLIIIKFTIEFSRTSSEQFIRDILINKIGLKYIVIGFNHHFGHNRKGNFEYLYRLSQELDFKIEVIPEQDVQHETVNSTTIRKAIKEGHIQRANSYLGYEYIILGGLGKGTHLFEDINFPTLTVQIEEAGKLIPTNGIYAVAVQWGGEQYRGMAIIWRTPNEERPFVEIHILNFDNIFPNDDAAIYFHKQIQFGITITNIDELRRELQNGKMLVDELVF